MDVMSLRRGLLSAMASGGGIPSFMNHLEGGQFSVSSEAYANIQLTNITQPKGILIYSNDFNLYSAKADKPKLGCYSALFIAGSDQYDQPTAQGSYIYSSNAYILENWGEGTNQEYTKAFATRTSNRGIRALKISDNFISVAGFGTGEYDLQLDTTYNWIAWD